MTDKEAINYLKQLYPNGGHCWLDEQRIEAVGMAIEALKEASVSEDLEKAAKENAKIERPDDTEVGYDINRFGGFVDGANWQKEQMMAKAVDATVHIDAGGYPYIPQIELYDYDKDIPLAKEGDKYKVILIKED